jgi:DNA repair exonuclease SbcCD ATPase subunit
MAQPEKRENSVLFSLRELRQIEESRVSEEESAIRNAEAAKVRAKQDEERRVREAAEAKERAIADEQRRIKELELAREHESRLKLEATEAAERARHQAALEQERLQQEMALRRAEVAKKRPTWMVAVMLTALVGLAGGVAFAIHKMGKSDEDQAARAVAEKNAADAQKAAKEAQETVDKLQRDLEDLDKRVGTAVDAVVAAQTDADRAGAKARLEKLRAEQAAQQQAIANAKAAADRAKRLGGLHVSQKCLDNPLAKGC